MAERIRVTFDSDLRRRRLGVLLRVVLALPAAAVVTVWSVLAAVAVVLMWFVALVRGRAPMRLHRFLRAYLQYATRFSAWFNLVSRPYPRVRRAHPLELVARRERQARLTTLFRLVLALPGLVLGSALGVVLGASAVAAWLVALVLGRTTEGLRELGAFCLRYQTEVTAYVLLLTPCAPRLGPPPS